mgnify:FL=1
MASRFCSHFMYIQAQEVLPGGTLGADPTSQSYNNVVITILDVNDNPPTFTQTHYSVRMSEAIQDNQAIPNLTMYVNDPDGVCMIWIQSYELYNNICFI